MTWLLSMALANAVLVVPLAVLAFLVGRYSRRPALAHVLWIVVLVKLVTPPLVEIPVGWRVDLYALANQTPAHSDDAPATSPLAPRHIPKEPSAAAPQRAGALVGVPEASHTSRPARPGSSGAAETVKSPRRFPAANRFQGWAPAAFSSAAVVRGLAIAWGLGSAVTLFLFAYRAWRFQRFLNLAIRVDDRLNERATQLARAVGLSRCAQVVVVESVVSPLLWGIGRSARLVFPAQLARQLDEKARDSLILHELAHFSRGDHWVRLLELVVQVLFWWHPVVWWARREIEASEEQCCDAWVVERQAGSRRLYAEALLATLDFLCDAPSPLPPAACGLGDAPFLRQRLTQIMQGDVSTRLSLPVRAAVLAGALVVLPLGPAVFARSSRPLPAITFPKSATASMNTEAPRVPLEEGENASGVSTSTAALPLESSRIRETAPAFSVPAIGPAPRPTSVLFASATSPSGKYRLEARTGYKTSLVHAVTEWRLDLSAHHVTCAGFTPDGRSFATGHEDRVVRVWDSESGGVQMSLKGCESEIKSVTFSPDGQYLAAGDADGRVLVWSLATGDVSHRFARQDAPIGAVRWSSGGDRLAIGVGDWASRERAALVVWVPQEGVVLSQHELDEPPGAVDWLPGDKALVVADWYGRAQVWSTESGEVISDLRLDKDLVSAAAWSPNCPLVPRWSADRLAAEIK